MGGMPTRPPSPARRPFTDQFDDEDEQTVITGFTDIITTITAATPATPPTGQFSATDSMAIANAFQGYSTAQTGLIDVVAQSGGVVEMVPAVGPAIRALLEGTTGSVNVSGHPLPTRLLLASPSYILGARDKLTIACSQRFVDPLTVSVGPAAGAVIVRTLPPLAVSLTQAVFAFT